MHLLASCKRSLPASRSITLLISWSFLIIGIALGIVASCITFYTLSKFGRRALILFSMSVITVMWTAVGISGAWRGTTGSTW